MRNFLRTLDLKVTYGAVIPWACVFFGHRFLPHPNGCGYQWYGDGYQWCSRRGCTYEVGDGEHAAV